MWCHILLGVGLLSLPVLIIEVVIRYDKYMVRKALGIERKRH